MFQSFIHFTLVTTFFLTSQNSNRQPNATHLSLNKITDFSGFGYRVVFLNDVTEVLVMSL